MQQSRSRFSHRHLLALSTFLVPLAILGALGWSELQRSGESEQAALDHGAKLFLASAKQAVEQQLAAQLPRYLEATKATLIDQEPVRTTLALRQQERFAALRDIVMLDLNLNIVEPVLPYYSVSLPLARDARGADSPTRGALQAAELLLDHGKLTEAIKLLDLIVARLEAANPPGSEERREERRPDLEESELNARFLLAAACRRVGNVPRAREQYEQVRRLATRFRAFSRDAVAYGMSAESAMAELGTREDRLRLLRDIAENKREENADGLLSAIADRLAAMFPADDSARGEVDDLLREEAQRAATRTFAGDYELVLRPVLFLRRRNAGTGDGAGEASNDERLVATLGGKTSLVCMREASAPEAEHWRCDWVCLHIDLDELLRPVWQQFATADSRFVLAVHESDDTPIVAPPATTPDDHVPPTVVVSGLTLRAFPADPARLAAEAATNERKRTLLIVALFVTALGGALWSWRSVSREAELASLKIDLVSRVSHELKTPLALVRMYGETLGMGRARDADQAAEFGSIIARESERLTVLIQRILDFSRQQAGTLAYQPRTIDLGELLRSVVDAYAPHLEARGAVLIDSLPAGIRVSCDANACESAIVNLLENAAKYARDGDGEHEIELSLTAAGNKAVVEVRDHGRGIPPAELGRVFEGFYRASNAGEVRGAGLGLSLVRHFARAHGGEVGAHQRAGGGTAMRLTLPLATTAPGAAAAAPARHPPASATNPATDP